MRFHIEIEEKYYEYAIDTINKKTINIRCVIGKSKFRNKCYARLTLNIAGYLKTEAKCCKSKKTKYKWDDSNIETDYFDLRSYSIQTHKCTKHCLKGCVLKHTCEGHVVSRDRKRRHLDEARNYSIKYYTDSTENAVLHADREVGFGLPNAIEKEKPLSGVEFFLEKKRFPKPSDREEVQGELLTRIYRPFSYMTVAVHCKHQGSTDQNRLVPDRAVRFWSWDRNGPGPQKF